MSEMLLENLFSSSLNILWLILGLYKVLNM
jgi:hypothetical protein